MSTTDIINNANGEIKVDNQDLEALMALAINAIDNRLRVGGIDGDTTNYIRWRKLAHRIADVVE